MSKLSNIHLKFVSFEYYRFIVGITISLNYEIIYENGCRKLSRKLLNGG